MEKSSGLPFTEDNSETTIFCTITYCGGPTIKFRCDGEIAFDPETCSEDTSRIMVIRPKKGKANICLSVVSVQL